jgi:2,3-bisphosphoglycerate-independent phosphoglycerate mutase
MSSGPIVLVILDGWGNAPDGPGNAIAAAHTPNMDRFVAEYPRTNLHCSGEDVGLPEGQMGNSEVGHLNIGAGYVVYQSITRIDLAIRDGSFAQSDVLKAITHHADRSSSTIHLVGLIGDGGVHAHHRHWRGLLDLFASSDVDQVAIHAIMDGRDTEPTSGVAFMQALLDDIDSTGVGKIATVSGRYYAMDRDKRWDRTERAYRAIVRGEAPVADDPVQVLRDSYESGTTDEFIDPVVIGPKPVPFQDGDAVIFVNFRADRMRQIVSAISAPDFDGFDVSDRPSDLAIATMTQYERDLPVQVIFPPDDVEYPLARVISDAGLKQFHIAETEKYAHVTYFINGGREEPFEGEDRAVVQSPDVPTYDHQPEMSAPGVTERAIQAISTGNYQFVVINYANGDMVGHTGDFDAAVKAIEAVDQGLGSIAQATLNAGGVVIATADHGNAEEMVIPGTDDVWTAHTLNTVPLVLVSSDDTLLRNVKFRPEGRLADIAPTVLEILGVTPAASMTGKSLIEQS